MRRLLRTSTPLLGLCLLLVLPAAAGARQAGGWRPPLDVPLVVRGFEPPVARWLAGHRGVDLAAAAGTTVRAPGPGVVTYAGMLAGRGVVVISHGELRTTYEPVSPLVTPGQPVGPGAPIGQVTPNTSHCRPAICLHWGLLRGDTYLDPLRLLDAAPVRLLPLWESGPRVRLVVGPPHPFCRDMGVDLRGGQ